MAKLITKIIFLVVLSSSVYSQQDELTISDSLFKSDSLSELNQTYTMAKSPLGAILRSAILPGWGQAYCESYWEIPIIWGFLGYYGYEWNRSNKEYKRFADLYRESLEAGAGTSTYKDLRDNWHDFRDNFAIYIGITYIINLLNAYVDAHLYDFSVEPDKLNGQPQLNLRLNLNSIFK